MTTPTEYREMAETCDSEALGLFNDGCPDASAHMLNVAAALREAAGEAERMQEMRTALEWMYATRRRMDSPAWVRAENKAREILYPADALLERDP
jgi:hypothetical protein